MSTSPLNLHIDGMHCGGCVGRVDKALRSVPGVTDASVNLATNTAQVQGNAKPDDLIAAVKQAGYSARLLADMSAKTVREISQLGETEQSAQQRRLFLGLVFGIPAVTLEMLLHHHDFLGMPLGHPLHAQLKFLAALLATVVMIFTGWPFFLRGIKSALRLAPNMDTLIALGALTAYIASTVSLIRWFPTRPTMEPPINEFHAAVTIIVLITLGKYLEARAKKHASSAVAGLSAQAAATATRIRPDGSLETIPAELIRLGDRLQILAHQQLPVDGQLIEGAGSVDLSLITGESIPVEIAASPRRPVAASRLAVLNSPIENQKSKIENLPGGATLADGRIVLAATSTAADSTVARILSLVNTAQASKTKIQSLADRVAAIFVPIILLLGAANFAAWMLLTHDLDRALITTIATIVIACPCAMGLATPTAVTVAMGRAARLGILFTKASALETARTITTVLFDKTGTLTTGALEVTQIHPTPNSGLSSQDFLRIAASIEQFSEHPLAKAVVARAVADAIALHRPADFHSFPGGGVTAMIQHRRYAAGSATYLTSLGIKFPSAAALPEDAGGATAIHLANLDDKTYLGLIALRDTLRPESADMLQTLHDRGYQIGVLTGDSEPAAKAALQNLPIDFLRANVRPEEKAAAVRNAGVPPASPRSNAGVPPASGRSNAGILPAPGGRDARVTRVAFIGDGINDGPALAAADLGIAVASSTHLAKSAGDVLLMNSQLSVIPEVLQLARRTLRIIKQNLFWAFAYNLAALPLAMLGLLSPGLAAAAMMLSSLTVVANALRLYRVKL